MLHLVIKHEYYEVTQKISWYVDTKKPSNCVPVPEIMTYPKPISQEQGGMLIT